MHDRKWWTNTLHVDPFVLFVSLPIFLTWVHGYFYSVSYLRSYHGHGRLSRNVPRGESSSDVTILSHRPRTISYPSLFLVALLLIQCCLFHHPRVTFKRRASRRLQCYRRQLRHLHSAKRGAPHDLSQLVARVPHGDVDVYLVRVLRSLLFTTLEKDGRTKVQW